MIFYLPAQKHPRDARHRSRACPCVFCAFHKNVHTGSTSVLHASHPTIPSRLEFTMHDINAFFAEQEQHMNLPDEDVDEYIRARLEDYRSNRYALHSIGSLLPVPLSRIITEVMLSITLFSRKVTHAKLIQALNHFSILTRKGMNSISLTKKCPCSTSHLPSHVALANLRSSVLQIEAQTRKTRTSSPGKEAKAIRDSQRDHVRSTHATYCFLT